VTRRTSAEVVNATLLEVFLAFVFVVLSIAWFEHASSAQQASRADSLAKAQSGLLKQRDSLSKALALVLSPYAPPCHVGATQKYFVTLTLTHTGVIDVRVNRAELRHPAGQRFVVSAEALADSFSDVIRFSKDSTCHFLAVVMDSTLSKESYKRGLRAVQEIFNMKGQYQ
jgi:hypothetical protein